MGESDKAKQTIKTHKKNPLLFFLFQSLQMCSNGLVIWFYVQRAPY